MLWLLRHAEAADGFPDDVRPLTERGIRQAQDAGRALARLGAKVDACLSSPKLRALQTAQHACAPIGVEITAEPRLSGEPFEVDNLISGLGDVLLVGHDPSFSLTLYDLTGAQARMRKGGLAAIQLDDSGAARSGEAGCRARAEREGKPEGELIALLRPSELSAIAAGERLAAGRGSR